MKRFLSAVFTVCLNLAEVVLFYLATVLNIGWATNIVYFLIAASFCLIVLGFIGLAKEDNKSLKKKFEKKHFLPRWWGLVIDLINIGMLVVAGWWFCVVFSSINVFLVQVFRSKLDELKKEEK